MASILMAEDDESLRVFLANALAALETRGYDLLLVDIVMPGKDGIELAQRATEYLPAMKVLFITGFAAVALNTRRTAANRNAKILSEPFHLPDLIAEIDKILAA